MSENVENIVQTVKVTEATKEYLEDMQRAYRRKTGKKLTQWDAVNMWLDAFKSTYSQENGQSLPPPSVPARTGAEEQLDRIDRIAPDTAKRLRQLIAAAAEELQGAEASRSTAPATTVATKRKS